MKKVRVSWITYLMPGLLVGENWDKDCEPGIDPEDVEWPKNAYAFRIMERTDVVHDGETYKGKAEQVGPLYYHPDSRVETLEEVRQNPRATDTLISNMRCNKWNRIIWTRWNNWPQPYEAKEIRVLPKKEKKDEPC
ncbi:MAG: hypothetical protein ABFE07_28475 [Armatimonadia bacterium]